MATEKQLLAAKKKFISSAIDLFNIKVQALEKHYDETMEAIAKLTADIDSSGWLERRDKSMDKQVGLRCTISSIRSLLEKEQQRISSWNSKGYFRRGKNTMGCMLNEEQEGILEEVLLDNLKVELNYFDFLEKKAVFKDALKALDDLNEARANFYLFLLLGLPTSSFWIGLFALFFVSTTVANIAFITSVLLCIPLLIFALVEDRLWESMHNELDEAIPKPTLLSQLRDFSFFQDETKNGLISLGINARSGRKSNKSEGLSPEPISSEYSTLLSKYPSMMGID
ncbi:MAG: hypothetical protein K0U37_02005 [Gammaproteobacteria bacterium]|nr:hypothetical protein [Gammaproteobacteria bacterium]